MSTRELSEILQALLNDVGGCEDGEELAIDEIDVDGVLYECRAESFQDRGILTSNDGIVLSLHDESEFQVTVVRSR